MSKKKPRFPHGGDRFIADKFLRGEQIEATLTTITQRLAQGRTSFALAGGCALQLYGSPRFTTDVDVIARAAPLNVSTVKTAEVREIGSLGFGGVELKIRSSGVAVDWIIRDDEYAPLFREALANAREPRGFGRLVVTLPYLGAMKVLANRAKDFQDLEFVLGPASTLYDYKELRAIVKRHLGPLAADQADYYRTLAQMGATIRPAGRGRP